MERHSWMSEDLEDEILADGGKVVDDFINTMEQMNPRKLKEALIEALAEANHGSWDAIDPIHFMGFAMILDDLRLYISSWEEPNKPNIES